MNSSDGSSSETTYQYAHEKGNQYLIDKNMIGIPLQTTVTQKQNDNDPGKQFPNQRFCIQPVRLMPMPELQD